MSELRFFKTPLPLSLAVIAAQGGVKGELDPALVFASLASLDLATPRDVSMFANSDSIELLRSTRAGACFVMAHHAHLVPAGTIALVTDDPSRALQRVAALLYPDSVKPVPSFGRTGIDATAIIHRDARLEPDVTIDPGVVIGPRVEIGTGTTIGANSTIGEGVRIGRGCAIDSHVSIAHALIGDGVVIHAGVRIGQSGPRLDVSADRRMAHLGRVIVQNDVEIGANAAIERGGMGDTVIGDGSRIGALAIVERDALIDRLAIVERP